MAPALPRETVEHMLTTKLGMSCDPRDHRWYYLTFEGRTIASTFVSAGGKYRTLGDDLVSKMARQLYINSGFFLGLVKCTKSLEDYFDARRNNGSL